MECTVVIPDLIPPRPAAALVDVYRDLRLPRLAFLLARASKRSLPGTSLETWLGRAFQLAGEEVPVAALSLLAEHGNPGEAWWLCADPVHLAPQQGEVRLMGPEALGLSRAEAEQLIAALQAHFTAGAASFHALRPDRWYLRFPQPLRLTTHALPEVEGRTVNALLPSGEDAPRLLRLLTEAQMLLFAHPVNQAREAAGRPTINSLWPWGGGRLPLVEARPYAHVWADDLMAQGLARAAGIPFAALPQGAADILPTNRGEGAFLVVLDALRGAAARGDAEAWQRRLRQLEEKWFAPLAEAFRKGRLASLTLLALGARHNMVFTLRRRARWRFWRRPRPLGHYADIF
jgi:hypothetical protein